MKISIIVFIVNLLLFFVDGIDEKSSVMLPITPRLMWGWGPGTSGYCGACSVQSVGLYYGNYITQQAVRDIVGNNWVLIGENANKALQRFYFDTTAWDFNHEKNPQWKSFLDWTKIALDKGEPVIIGIYMKEKPGDEDYDHIVPAIGYDNDAKGNIASLFFNDLHSNLTIRKDLVDHFVQTRKQCSANPIRFDYCLPKSVDYGLQVHGIKDPRGVTKPVQLTLSSWTEPDYSVEDKKHEKPCSLTAVAHISGLTPGQSYHLLRFDSVTLIPENGEFSKAKFSSSVKFTTSSETYNVTDTFMSNSTVFYRCVEV